MAETFAAIWVDVTTQLRVLRLTAMKVTKANGSRKTLLREARNC
jgi:hypothetical protein